jgi:uncharacterized membrane protein (UPF0127 family)
MRNTFIPLDMVFITSDGTVENVHVNARRRTQHRSSGVPVQFVLEIRRALRRNLGSPSDKAEHPRMKVVQ